MATIESRDIGTPDEVREMPLGRAEVISIAGSQVMRTRLQPGWRWSEHAKPKAGTEWCEAPHFHYMVSGTLGLRMSDGAETVMRAGEVACIPPGHDAWVIGDEEVIAIDWGGAHVWAGGDS